MKKQKIYARVSIKEDKLFECRKWCREHLGPARPEGVPLSKLPWFTRINRNYKFSHTQIDSCTFTLKSVPQYQANFYFRDHRLATMFALQWADEILY